MSKSKYSKVKGTGLLCGMSRCEDFKFQQAGKGQTVANRVQNRQMRRAMRKK
jgi:hypothetical protein